MKRRITLLWLLALFSCHHAPHAANSAARYSTKSEAAMSVSPELKKLHFDYDKDPACGMPIHAGLLDSTVYKGKLYGFCSKECKEAFLKDPNSYIAEIKK
jgi:YHS domain-containing protein